MALTERGKVVALVTTSIFATAALILLVKRASTKRSLTKSQGVTAAAAGSTLSSSAQAPSMYSVIFVLGGPGAGKGTQCAKIVEEFGYVHLSAGDLLRAERSKSGNLADMINSYIREGAIVPAAITVQLLRTAMETSGKGKFLIDGFPRNPENLLVWEQIMSSVCVVEFLLFLDCPEEVMERRLLKRGESSGRDDDNKEAIKKRFHTYRDSTMPIIEHFNRHGKTRKIQADRSEEEVFADVAALFQYEVIFVLGGPGSGKGTQCAKLEEDFTITHLSAGDLLRAERKRGGELGAMIDQYIAEGKVVPAKVTVRLLRTAMNETLAMPPQRGSHKKQLRRKTFLVDGFPRNLENLTVWEEDMEQVALVHSLLFLDCPEEVMVQRLLKRGETSGRTDDNAESIRKRLVTYNESTMPIIQKFEAQGKVKRVGSDQPIDAVYADVYEHVATLCR